MRQLKSLKFIIALAFPLATLAQEKIDAVMMQKIRQEGLNNSKVMDIAFYLTDASGPRLTNSPGFFRAANYAKQQLSQWGLSNAMLDPWGEFGKGWELQKSYIAMTVPYYKNLIAYPQTWTAGTNGLKTAEVLVITATDSAGLDAFRGRLGGKILILDRTDNYTQSYKADASRYEDSSLEKMSNAAMQQGGGGRQQQVPTTDTAELRRRREQFQRFQGPQIMQATLRTLAQQEGAVAILTTSPRNHDGTVFVQGGGVYKGSDPANFLTLGMAYEDYMTLLRLAKAGMPVKMDVDVKTAFQTNDLQGYNVIAEIPGTDPALKDEVVMLGGHLDSWHSGTGATDNAAGCAVMMEALRILKTTGAKPRRTIRIALWSGEEEGLLGSSGYVKKTFGDPATMQLTPAHEKLSAYYNIDNGTGKIRGIYLQGNEAERSIFQQWLTPFNDLGAKTVTISNTGGTDHQSFDALGLPGFQFIQEPMEYDTRTHHSNMDTYDHLSAADLKQTATIVAAFVYNTAMRDEKMPRKPLPQPRPAGGRRL
ncbi:MAG: family metallo-hydrolase [Chitinophagaceae bacterium]|nr:family metallo-hydrolase [Chitinophagaceae bacterium]